MAKRSIIHLASNETSTPQQTAGLLDRVSQVSERQAMNLVNRRSRPGENEGASAAKRSHPLCTGGSGKDFAHTCKPDLGPKAFLRRHFAGLRFRFRRQQNPRA